MEGGKQAFDVVMKHLNDFDGNETSWWVLCFYSIDMNIKDTKSTGCVIITSKKFTLNENGQLGDFIG